MSKYKLRKKILKIRKAINSNNITIDFNKVINLIKKEKGNKKNIGGYYPVNYEIDDLEILKELEKRARQEIVDFTTTNSFNYKIINIEKQKQSIGIFPKVIITFNIKNQDGSIVLTKDEAKKELIELKEFLDLGIITQEEFDTKAVSLKKILLGN